MLKDFRKYFWEENRLATFLVLIGSIVQLALIFPSGTLTKNGLVFWGPHYHDTMWHVAVAQKLSNLQFVNPIFAGDKLQNYHYLTNLLIGLAYKLTNINILTLTFKIFPSILAIGSGYLVYDVCKKLFNKKAALWAIFFFYFGSNFNFVFGFLGKGTPFWETMLWVQQSHSNFTNLPLASSYFVFLLAVFLLQKYFKSKNTKLLVLSSFLFGLLPITKGFAIIFLPALLLSGLYRLLFKKNKDLVLASLFSIFVAYVTLNPFMTRSNQFIFEPGYFLRTMYEAKDRLNMADWALKLDFYKSVGSYHRIIWMWGSALFTFFFFNLGTRIIALKNISNLRKYLKSEIHIILLSSAFVFAAFPLFFLTKGVAWNSIQFFYYFLFILGIYAAPIAAKSSNFVKLVIIVLTLPVVIQTFCSYYSHPADATVSSSELKLISEIDPRDNVLTLPPELSTVYISAINGNSIYLGDELMAQVPGHDYGGRLQGLKDSFSDPEKFSKLVDKNNIKWVYVVGNYEFPTDNFNLIDEKENYKLYKIK